MNSSRFFTQLVCLCLVAVFSETLGQLSVIDIPDQGKVLGVEVSKVRIQKIVAYYGIPYAQPPTGLLRFAPPVTNPLPSWKDVKREFDFKPSCLQSKENYKESELNFLHLLGDIDLTSSNMSEDCLYLNIFVPNGAAKSHEFATIIWIHPGNFSTGLVSIWNPHTLVYRQRVIVVTFGWRLNIMGFFTTTDEQAPGNYGLMDQQAAMQWVKNNIKLFGGNPNNICLMGYGAGATSVGIHMMNQISRPLFHKAIIMSGSLFQASSIKYPEEDLQLVDRLATHFGCDKQPTSRLLECLRRLEAKDLLAQTLNVNWRPLVDKDIDNYSMPFITGLPKSVFEGQTSSQTHAKIPILTGYTNMEHGLDIDDLINNTDKYDRNSLQKLLDSFIREDLPDTTNITDSECYNFKHVTDSVMFFYGPDIPIYNVETFRKTAINLLVEKTYASSAILLASYLSKAKPTYVYRFDMKPSSEIANKNIPSWVKVPHLFDLIYVWGVPYLKPDQQEWDPRDKRISDTVMSFWTSFAKTSDPTPPETIVPIKWEPYTEKKPGLLILDNNIHMSDANSVNHKAFKFWNDYYFKVLSVGADCCSYSHSSTVDVFQFMFYFIVGAYLITSL